MLLYITSGLSSQQAQKVYYVAFFSFTNLERRRQECLISQKNTVEGVGVVWKEDCAVIYPGFEVYKRQQRTQNTAGLVT